MLIKGLKGTADASRFEHLPAGLQSFEQDRQAPKALRRPNSALTLSYTAALTLDGPDSLPDASALHRRPCRRARRNIHKPISAAPTRAASRQQRERATSARCSAASAPPPGNARLHLAAEGPPQPEALESACRRWCVPYVSLCRCRTRHLTGWPVEASRPNSVLMAAMYIGYGSRIWNSYGSGHSSDGLRSSGDGARVGSASSYEAAPRSVSAITAPVSPSAPAASA